MTFNVFLGGASIGALFVRHCLQLFNVHVARFKLGSDMVEYFVLIEEEPMLNTNKKLLPTP